jgi:hypothetical protein
MKVRLRAGSDAYTRRTFHSTRRGSRKICHKGIRNPGAKQDMVRIPVDRDRAFRFNVTKDSEFE